MGWTAAASVITKDYWGPGDDDFNRISKSHPAMEDLAQAMSLLQKNGHTCDCTLDIGLLCVRATGAALFEAVGQVRPSSGVRYADEVKEMVAKADWTLSSENYDDSNKAVAKAFLEVCAKHDLGIDLG